ncbi:MAG: hypothetical protein H0U21_09040 [Acidimicrobiia bacterium]|nr:hypothetical protein [Acidimicrobiia bacterium]
MSVTEYDCVFDLAEAVGHQKYVGADDEAGLGDGRAVAAVVEIDGRLWEVHADTRTARLRDLLAAIDADIAPRLRRTPAGRVALDDGRIEGLFLYEVEQRPVQARRSIIETFTCSTCWLIKPTTQRSADGMRCTECHADG